MVFALMHLWADLLGTGLYSSSAACHHMKTQGANNHRLLFNRVLLLVFTVSLCNCGKSTIAPINCALCL